jgi:uncharacterized membrane protein
MPFACYAAGVTAVFAKSGVAGINLNLATAIRTKCNCFVQLVDRDLKDSGLF